MGVGKFLRKRADEFSVAKAEFEKGCEILGRPSDPRSVAQRAERMRAGREALRIEAEKAANHSGGWQDAAHGYIDSQPVTFALGWGTKEGEVLLANGHVNTSQGSSFWKGGHNHYGKGNGPNANVKDRGIYTGPGA